MQASSNADVAGENNVDVDSDKSGKHNLGVLHIKLVSSIKQWPIYNKWLKGLGLECRLWAYFVFSQDVLSSNDFITMTEN